MIKIDNQISKLVIKFKQISTLEIGKLSNYKEKILEPVQKQVTSNFSKGQSGEGQKWKRLLEATVEQKKKEDFPEDPLVRTKVLQNAVDSLKAQPEGQGKVLSIGLGGDSKVKRIGLFHQLGTKTIPSRPFLTINTRISEILTNIIVKEEIENIKKALQ